MQTAITTTIVRLTCCYCMLTATASLTVHGDTDNAPTTEEPDAPKACPEIAEGAHVRFPGPPARTGGSVGGVGDRPAAQLWVAITA
jgi:hypothetical protein